MSEEVQLFLAGWQGAIFKVVCRIYIFFFLFFLNENQTDQPGFAKSLSMCVIGYLTKSS